MEKNAPFKTKENGRIVGGLIIIAVGAVLLLRNTGFYLPGWLFSWPMILILVGVYTGFKHNFKNNSWLIIMGVGLFFLIRKSLPGLSNEPLFWPLVIIGIGVLFILRPRNGIFNKFGGNSDLEQWQSGESVPATAEDAVVPDRSDLLFVRTVFSGVKRSILSKNFQGGTISTVFGGTEIDLTQAEINGKVELRFEVLFGGAKLIVPSHWAVQNEIDGVFHGVEDNRRFNPDAALNPGKILILKGSVTFGGIEIRSY